MNETPSNIKMKWAGSILIGLALLAIGLMGHSYLEVWLSNPELTREQFGSGKAVKNLCALLTVGGASLIFMGPILVGA